MIIGTEGNGTLNTISPDEVMKILYTHDTIYVPPTEEGDIPLEVGLGCSWHKCVFCDFARDKFCIHPIEKIQNSLYYLQQIHRDKNKMFFLGENVFCLSTERLLEIIGEVNYFMPWVEEFAMYSRADDILRKSVDELKLLRSRGVRRLHVGVESGSDSILHWMNKGVTTQQFIRAFRRLDMVGIDYYITLIPGLGGLKYSDMHAIETARLLNQIHPKNIWCLKLKVWPNTPLEKLVKNGEFIEMTPTEILQEEHLMFQNINMTHECEYVDSTVLNKFTVIGKLPEQKQKMLECMEYLIRNYGERRE